MQSVCSKSVSINLRFRFMVTLVLLHQRMSAFSSWLMVFIQRSQLSILCYKCASSISPRNVSCRACGAWQSRMMLHMSSFVDTITSFSRSIVFENENKAAQPPHWLLKLTAWQLTPLITAARLFQVEQASNPQLAIIVSVRKRQNATTTVVQRNATEGHYTTQRTQQHAHNRCDRYTTG
jgi:ribosomal protein L40E